MELLDSTSPFGPILWVLLVIAASILYRKSQGKPIYPRKPGNAIFYESWASGHSKRDLLTMIGGARNCLMVAVTPERFIVRPNFPFNLMFLPEVYDLEYNIPRNQVRSITPIDGLFGKSVRIELERPSGTLRTIQLLLKDREKFVQVLGSAL